MSVKGSPIEIQTAAHWNLIGCTMTAPAGCVIAHQYSPATLVLFCSHSGKKKLGAS